MNGWDRIEWVYGPICDKYPDAAVELDETVLGEALLDELERPPWWRDIDAQRRELRSAA